MSMCGTLSAILGELICIGAVAGYFYGKPTVMGHKAITVFTIGIGFMVLGCFKKLWCLEKAICQPASGK